MRLLCKQFERRDIKGFNKRIQKTKELKKNNDYFFLLKIPTKINGITNQSVRARGVLKIFKVKSLNSPIKSCGKKEKTVLNIIPTKNNP